MLDHYCERVTAGLMAEPLNATTNAAFVLAAAMAAVMLRRRAATLAGRRELWLLTALLASIGIGSTLWHTVASGWALLADVVPILLFVYVYLLVFLLYVPALSGRSAALVLAAYLSLDQLLQHTAPADVLNGSLFYLPAWAAMSVAAAWLAHRRHRIAARVSLAAVLFSVSLLLRSVDLAMCEMLPSGTHFMWHLLNAVVLYLLLTALMAGETPNAERRRHGV